MKVFRWLHLTDLHWGSKDHKNLWGSIQPKWFEDLERIQNKCGGPFDAVFFTGDLVNWGKEEEFQELTSRLQELFKHLKTLYSNSNPHLLVVPGNHDLTRLDEPDSDCKMLTQHWESDLDTQNAIWEQKTTSGPWKTVQKAFKNYTQWYASVSSEFNVPKTLKPGLLPGEFAVSLDKEGLKIGILGLNTAFLQLTSGNFKGKIDLHPKQITIPCDMMFQNWVDQHHTCLLLSHHPLDWLSKNGKTVYYDPIAVPGRFALHLCGHNHQAEMLEMLGGGNSQGRRILCGRAIFGMDPYTDEQGNPQKTRTFGYSAGALDFSETQPLIHLWPRRMDLKGDGVWDFNVDTLFHIKENQAIEPIPIKPNGKKTEPVVPLPLSSSIDTALSQTMAPDVPRPLPLGPQIKALVKQQIYTMLKTMNSLKCFRGVLSAMFPPVLPGVDIDDHTVEALLAMELNEAIIQLQIAVSQCINRLKEEGKNADDLTLTWDNCVSILGWLVLTGVNDQWAAQAALEMAKNSRALDLEVPVETEMGLDIVAARFKNLKASFNLNADGSDVIAKGRIPSEKWQIESGWSLTEKVFTLKKQLWKQLNRLAADKKVEKSEQTLTRELRQILHSRRRMGENHYLVLNKQDPNQEESVYRQLAADLQNLDIFYLVSDSNQGMMAIIAEPELQTQIREFLYIKTTIKEG